MNICALCCQYEYATAGQNKVNNQYIWHSDHFLLFSSRAPGDENRRQMVVGNASSEVSVIATSSS